ncbi:MAG: VOC family protein [Anaerolineae bacterium]
MPRVIHFEISAASPERAVAFYGGVFGLKIEKWDPVEYWLVSTGDDAEPGIGGAITRRDEMMQGTVNTIGVDSVDKYETLVQASGGKILMPKRAIPGIGYMAYCEDTEGNVFGIMENDASAH